MRRWLASPDLLHAPALVLLVPVFLIPTVALLAVSFTSDAGTFGYYGDMLDSEVFRTVFVRSLVTAATVTAISLAIGLPFAVVAVRAGVRLRYLLFGVIAASLFFSVIVRSYAWLALLGSDGPVVTVLGFFGKDTDGLSLSRSGFAVTVGLVQYGVPFMVLAIADVLRRVDVDIDRAAATLGAGPLSRFFRITVPLIAPGIIAGVTIVFTTTLGYFVIPAILGSPEQQMIGQLISQQVGTSVNTGLGAAIAATLLVVSMAILLTFQWLAGRVARV